MLKKIPVVLGAILLTLIVLEVGVRLIGLSVNEMKPTDTHTGLRVFPADNQIVYRTSCYTNTIATNHLGLHTYDFSTDKPVNVKRIVVVGDSFIEADQVTRDQHFTKRLQDALNASTSSTVRYEVIPVGINGNGTYANFQYLVAYGLSFHPDLVIDAFNTNDPVNDADLTNLDQKITDLKAMVVASSTTPTLTFRQMLTAWEKQLAKKSALTVYVYSKYLGWESAKKIQQSEQTHEPVLDFQVYLPHPSAAMETAWIRQQTLLLAMRDVAAAHGAKFLVMTIAAAERIHPSLRDAFLQQIPASIRTDVRFDEVEQRVQNIMADSDIPVLTLYQPFLDFAAQDPHLIGWPCDLHWNAVGHQWAERVLYGYLKQHSDLLP